MAPPPEVCTNCGETSEEPSDGLCAKCQSIHAQTIAPEAADTRPSGDVGVAGVGLKEFGEYELIEEVARGGMGVIYKARHRKLNRIAALKMILSGRFSSEEELQRFHIEAAAAAKLDHPGIVPVYEIGEAEGQAFFAMKFIEGGSLADQIDSFRDRPKDAIRLLAKVVRAVHHAHQRGVLHRDLKPANILVDESGEPLITDLGLAKTAGADSNLTNTGAVLGTPSYMPPEQASGGGVVTTAADIYSLGAIMYELLSSQPPYKGTTAIETVMQVLEGPPEALQSKNASVDRDLEMICMKCLEREPNARYSSASALADDLEAWLSGDPISLKPPSLMARTGRWFRNNRRLAYAGFAALISIPLILPFVLDLVSGGQFTSIYDRFPESERPVLFAIAKGVPQWAGAVGAMFMVLILWPALGWLNALVTRPTSVRQAIGAGVRTSILLGTIFGLLMGWLVVARTIAQASERPTRVLAEAVWPPNDDDGTDRAKAVIDMYPGLDEIPEAQRAAVFASRMKSDQVALGPTAMGLSFLAFLILAVPVIYGTVIGYVLLGRKNWFWVSYIRHTVAWWSSTMGILILVGGLIPGAVNVNGKPTPVTVLPVIAVALVCGFVTWLVLRKWRRRSDTVAMDSNAILSSAT